MASANAYDKAFAYSMAGNAAANMNDQAKAATYFGKAVDANGLDNDSHYATMYNLAIIQYGEEKYADALATIDRFFGGNQIGQSRSASVPCGRAGRLKTAMTKRPQSTKT